MGGKSLGFHLEHVIMRLTLKCILCVNASRVGMGKDIEGCVQQKSAVKHSWWRAGILFTRRPLEGSERTLHALKHNADALLLLCQYAAICPGFSARHPSAIHWAVPQGLCQRAEFAEQGVLSPLGWRWVPLRGAFRQRVLPEHPSLPGSSGTTVPFLRSG